MAVEEWFDIVTPEGKVIGKAPRSVVHGTPELLHQVVHIHIFNRQGQLFLQKRSKTKDLYPGFWDTAVGGHVNSGETVETALQREAQEELGIDASDCQPLFRYVMRNIYESELVNAFFMVHDGPFILNRDEISEGKFWSLPEIGKNLGKALFTPNFEDEYQRLLNSEKIKKP